MAEQKTISITAEIKKKLREIPEGQQKTYLVDLFTREIVGWSVLPNHSVQRCQKLVGKVS